MKVVPLQKTFAAARVRHELKKGLCQASDGAAYQAFNTEPHGTVPMEKTGSRIGQRTCVMN